MKIGFITYQHIIGKPEGIPNEWPSETMYVETQEELPNENWQLMTVEEYETYLASHKAEYDAWVLGQQVGNILIESYKIDEYDGSGLLLNTTWYQDKTEEGSYINKARDVVYAYGDNSILHSYTDTKYDSLGKISASSTTNYFTDPVTNRIIVETT